MAFREFRYDRRGCQAIDPRVQDARFVQQLQDAIQLVMQDWHPASVDDEFLYLLDDLLLQFVIHPDDPAILLLAGAQLVADRRR